MAPLAADAACPPPLFPSFCVHMPVAVPVLSAASLRCVGSPFAPLPYLPLPPCPDSPRALTPPLLHIALPACQPLAYVHALHRQPRCLLCIAPLHPLPSPAWLSPQFRSLTPVVHVACASYARRGGACPIGASLLACWLPAQSGRLAPLTRFFGLPSSKV